MKKHYKEYTQEDRAIREVKRLKGFLRDQVYVSIVTKKGYKYIEGTLLDVDGFVDITLDDKHIPFISENGSINAIYTNDKRVMIYSNPFVNKSNYNDVDKLKREFYGDRVADLQKEREVKKQLDIRNVERTENEDIEERYQYIIKTALIKDSTKYVVENRKAEWIKFINNNVYDRLSCMILTRVFICLKDIAFNGDVRRMVKSYYYDETLTDDIKDYITLVLSQYTYCGNTVIDVYESLKDENKKLTLK